mmetsp:Transcript_26811/g.77268  ORF Transcript_26811/g.77268 Transcript_26811/m.77268 type:complete len:237 (-) Transcript_26811:84-794(-)
MSLRFADGPTMIAPMDESSCHMHASGPLSARRPDAEIWSTARVTSEARESKSRIIFGYGSLIWKVGFPYERRYPCRIEGPYARRFWMRNADHRGTADFPGRCATLIRDPCSDGLAGVAYSIPEAEAEAAFASLDFRERHGYTRDVATIVTGDGERLEAHVYYYSGDAKAGGACVWGEPIEETAAVVARAKGPSGTNLEYVRMLASSVQQLDIAGARDEYLDTLLGLSDAAASAAQL